MNKRFAVKLRRFIARNFSRVVLIFYKQKIYLLNFRKKPPVIILTPGKVGSSSVYYILKRKLTNHVFHIHQISEEGIKTSCKNHLKSDRKSCPLHLIISKLLRKKLKSYHGHKFIICIVREPISRAISAFYQNTEFYRYTIENSNLEIDTGTSLKLLDNIFKENISQQLEIWFQTEIEQEFGIDVFSKPFKTEKGFQIYKSGNVSLLLLKMESMNEVFNNAIQEFFNTDKQFELKSFNIAENKYYSVSYAEAKKSFKLSKEKLDEIIQTKYFHHFYLEQEQTIRKKWQKNLM